MSKLEEIRARCFDRDKGKDIHFPDARDDCAKLLRMVDERDRKLDVARSGMIEAMSQSTYTQMSAAIIQALAQIGETDDS